MDPQLVYLLGMIAGKGIIKRTNTRTTVIIEIPHKSLEINKQNTTLSVKASLEDIRNVIQPLIGVNLYSTLQHSKTIIQFTKPSEDFLIREINRHVRKFSSWKTFRIPADIMHGSTDMKKEFMIGLADVTAHIRQSNSAYGHKYNHRVYIEIPQNWYMVIDIANLLKDLNIPIHVINWGHPNIRDPRLLDYYKGNKNASFREHQIKIFAEEFLPIGFRIEHKRIALEQLSGLNLKEWNKHIQDKMNGIKDAEKRQAYESKLDHLEEIHHKFYWETRFIAKEKPMHPLENDPRIPKTIRGKHFDSWKSICEELGYSGDNANHE